MRLRRKLQSLTIVLSSCSWGAGVWATPEDGSYGLIHGGACEYLREAGYSVINLSGPGSDPWALYHYLHAFTVCNQHLDLSIYYLQSDITRSWPYIGAEVTDDINADVENAYHRHYEKMNEMAQTFHSRIKIIGGLTDVIVDLSRYPHLELLHPSICQIIDPRIELTGLVDFHRVETFLLENYERHKKSLTDTLEKSLARRDFWKSRADYFWPDGQHLNWQGHKLLAEIMIESEKKHADEKV